MTDFAVVIPTYRRPAYLAEAVKSVLAQTHPPAEVIVVCDGPGSSIPDELHRSPVRVIEQPHGGESVARNTGIAAAGSEWVCFLDDDDLWHPDRLRLTARVSGQRRPECQAVTASSWTFASEPTDGVELVARDLAGCLDAASRTEPKTDMSYLDINGRSFELLLERNRGNISGTTVRRDVLLRAGAFPVGYTCGADWVMFINVARYTEWHYLDARLSFVRIHPGNNTSANPTNGLMTVRAIRKVWADRIPVRCLPTGIWLTTAPTIAGPSRTRCGTRSGVGTSGWRSTPSAKGSPYSPDAGTRPTCWCHRRSRGGSSVWCGTVVADGGGGRPWNCPLPICGHRRPAPGNGRRHVPEGRSDPGPAG